MLGLTLEQMTLMSNMGVSIGTILLAFFTWRLIRSNNLQAKLIRKQAEILKTSSNPFLQAKDIKFIGNKIKLTVKNVGEGDAYFIGIHSDFSTTTMKIKEYLIQNEKMHASVNWEYDPKPLVDNFDGEERFIRDNGNVTFLKRKGYQNVILKPSEEIKFEVEPQFFVYYQQKNKFKDGKTFGRRIDLIRLINVLKGNDIRFVNIDLSIVCKNSFQEIMEYLPVSNFIFDIKNHKCLQDAFKSNYKQTLKVLGYREFESTMGSSDDWSYGLKTYKDD